MLLETDFSSAFDLVEVAWMLTEMECAILKIGYGKKIQKIPQPRMISRNITDNANPSVPTMRAYNFLRLGEIMRLRIWSASIGNTKRGYTIGCLTIPATIRNSPRIAIESEP